MNSKKMVKFQKYLMLMLIATLSLVTVSCGDKDDDDEPAPAQNTIVGQWIQKNIDGEGADYVICFENNGTGWMKWSDESYRDDFTYSVQGNKLSMSEDDYNWTCTFEFSGSTLVVHGNLWGEEDDISLFNLKRMN